MMKKLKSYIIILLLCLTVVMQAQEDSVIVLSFDDYMKAVSEHHPLARQAELQQVQGEASLRMARGAFDPKAVADVNQKYFKDTDYYSLVQGGLKIPTWFGVELEAGYEQNGGVFLNPENETPSAGLYYAGISLPVGQGLFIDERRAELRKAKIFTQVTDAQRRLMLNELLYNAGQAYWNWFMAYYTYQIYADAVANAQERLEAVKNGFTYGDRPAIDTVEASIQVQNRQLNLQQAELDLINGRALLSVYLWADGLVPLEPAENTVPMPVGELGNLPQVTEEMELSVESHPELVRSRLVIEQLEIERRWKAEQLKPVLNIKYNPITEPVDGEPFANYSVNNYTWGLQFAFPLFLRKERGALELAKVKLMESGLKLRNKQAELNFKAIASFNEWQTADSQISLYDRTVSDYNRLLEGEREMFDAGESSLFMVNSREIGYINAQVKLVELRAKRQKAALSVRYALGELVD